MQDVFEKSHSEPKTPTTNTSNAFGAMASFLVPKFSGAALVGNLPNEKLHASMDKEKTTGIDRQIVRPPVEHNWSFPGVVLNNKLPQIFQHELIQNFSVNMFCKVHALMSL